jgi:hypothetical protein
MTKPYQPSNGSEGDWFTSKFCDRCKHNDDQVERYCDILTRAYWCLPSEPAYPSEWITDDSGPRCTAFEPDGGES